MNQPLNQAARILRGKLQDQLPRSGVKNAKNASKRRGFFQDSDDLEAGRESPEPKLGFGLIGWVSFGWNVCLVGMLIWVVVSNIFFTLFGEDSQFDQLIFFKGVETTN